MNKITLANESLGWKFKSTAQPKELFNRYLVYYLACLKVILLFNLLWISLTIQIDKRLLSKWIKDFLYLLPKRYRSDGASTSIKYLAMLLSGICLVALSVVYNSKAGDQILNGQPNLGNLQLTSDLIINQAINGGEIRINPLASFSLVKSPTINNGLKPKNNATAPIVNGPRQLNTNFTTFPTWSQNFSFYQSPTLNAKYWNIYQGIPPNSNHEFEYYTSAKSNINITNNSLNITALKQIFQNGYDYSSGRIDTQGKKSFLYGRINVTAKVPVGVGVWPAVWLLPNNNYYRNLSPSSDTLRYLNGGEIDLIEEVGFDPNIEYGIVHSLSDLSNPYGVGSYNSAYVTNGSTSYNLYSLLWTPTSITFEINNQPFYRYSKPKNANFTNWPFNQPFYLIANLAVGGIWGGEDKSVYPSGVDNSIFPSTLKIKSIYYYPLAQK